MSLREDMWKYEQITGESAEHVPIIKLGAFLDGYEMGLNALEQTRLIPVSERMPEVGEKVLCQCQANIYEVLKLTADGWYHDKNHCYMLGFVIAWMPLPQPYREGMRND